jgi:hypothetical protein
MSNGFPVFTDFRFVRLDDTLNWLKSLVGLLVSCLFNPLRVMPPRPRRDSPLSSSLHNARTKSIRNVVTNEVGIHFIQYLTAIGRIRSAGSVRQDIDFCSR